MSKTKKEVAAEAQVSVQPQVAQIRLCSLHNRMNYAQPVSYNGDTLFVPPNGSVDKVVVEHLPAELPRGIVRSEIY
ncbi:hypothetical protein GR7B_00134 [Vibrio phage vB_VcorM_GR7B]|nr:hypothetical protein GR7B_00134 [Vibrio phage vB_VcorM_GR7B]